MAKKVRITWRTVAKRREHYERGVYKVYVNGKELREFVGEPEKSINRFNRTIRAFKLAGYKVVKEAGNYLAGAELVWVHLELK